MLIPVQSNGTQEDGESRDAGYALLEILVTLAILSLALSTLWTMFSDGARRAIRAEVMAQASLHARSLLDKIGADIPLKHGLTTGQFDDGLWWQLRIEPFGAAMDQRAWPVAAYSVTAEVSWRDGTKDRAFSLATVRLGPKEVSR